jgi:hypothetical protein
MAQILLALYLTGLVWTAGQLAHIHLRPDPPDPQPTWSDFANAWDNAPAYVVLSFVWCGTLCTLWPAVDLVRLILKVSRWLGRHDE